MKSFFAVLLRPWGNNSLVSIGNCGRPIEQMDTEPFLFTLKFTNMKKSLLMIVLASAAITASAQWRDNGRKGQGNNNFQNAALVVNTANNRMVYVSIDNNAIYQSNNGNGYRNSIYLSSIVAGRHQLQVYEWRSGFFGKQRKVVLYTANIYLKGGYETSLLMNAYGQAMLTERAINRGYNDGGYGNNGNGQGRGYDRDRDRQRKNDWDDRDDRNRERRGDNRRGEE